MKCWTLKPNPKNLNAKTWNLNLNPNHKPYTLNPNIDQDPNYILDVEPKSCTLNSRDRSLKPKP